MLDTTIARAERATTRDELQGLTVDLRDGWKLRHVAYQRIADEDDAFALGTYPQSWSDHYRDNNYLRIDPVVRASLRRGRPAFWGEFDWSGKGARLLLGETIGRGLGNQGFSIPPRGPSGHLAIFTLKGSGSDLAWRSFVESRLPDLLLTAQWIDQRFLDLTDDPAEVPTRALSPREEEALTCLAQGYSRSRASERLEISEHTLRVYIESARHKLGAMNTTHAVARALSLGLIVP